jgi:hypothetical protein
MAIPDPAAPQGGGALVSLVQTDNSGRFRLENIPPGRYYIQAGLIDLPSYYPGVASLNGATAIQITSGAEVTGLDFTLTRPAGVRVSGRIPLTVTPRPVMIRLIGGTSLSGTISADGSFEFLRVTPGTYTIMLSPANTLLPNATVVVNDKDIVLGLPTGLGVKVSGVVGLGPFSPRPALQRLVLTGSSAWAQVETVVAAGGKFELPGIPAGTYTLRTLPGTSAPLATITVADREITGLVVPAFVELAGRVAMDDGGPMPPASFALMIEARRADGSILSTAVRPDGTFRLPLAEGEYRIAHGKLPPGASTRSLRYGSTDLLNEPLRLNGTAAPSEIRLTLSR